MVFGENHSFSKIYINMHFHIVLKSGEIGDFFGFRCFAETGKSWVKFLFFEAVIYENFSYLNVTIYAMIQISLI